MLCSNYMHYRKKSKDHKLTWIQSVGKRNSLCMKTVWWVICITVLDHSELPVFILQHKVLCSLHQGDKTRVTWQNNTHLFHYQLLHHLLSLTTYLVVWNTSVNATSCNLLPHSVVAIQVVNSVWPEKVLFRAFRPEKDLWNLSFPGTNVLHLSSSQVVQHRGWYKVEILFYMEIWYLVYYFLI